MAHFDPLTTNAIELVTLLSANKLTSVDIVTQYLDQIGRRNPSLHAFLSIAPRDLLLREASELDKERLQGRMRSPLHGIPIVIKDVFITASLLGMPTTAGSPALLDAKASSNSPIVQRLLDAGMIILGKTNMTELAGMKHPTVMPGWSPVAGQTLSPYVGPIEEGETLLGHSAPGGSSTGSAVAVAAGFAPLALGTETIGSIITPASRAGLYALKPTVGAVQGTEKGMYTLTEFFDSPGGMAKGVRDLREVMEVLMPNRGVGYRMGVSGEGCGRWEGLEVGFLDAGVWKMAHGMCKDIGGAGREMGEAYESVVEKIRAQGGTVKYPAEIADIRALSVDGEDAIMPIAFWDFKNICIPRFLGGFDEAPVKNLADIVRFNEEHKEQCLPPPYTGQEDLKKALANNATEEHITALKVALRKKAKNILNEALDSAGVTLIAALADSPLCIHAAAAGYPIATVPLGQLRYNGRPFGLCVIARGDDEETLLRFMDMYESTVASPRPTPLFRGL
ncbi:amidase signature domain-containing protein [Schizothecium vesticola]|uniref:Amidase signature domain-containing protein n=1 Tax=Schizothecium vesticola TaxID=314040 RepID=A0AA40K9T7_9PEZI|nr:amidase signature domain-containing protein [Schizothecium vesticola]